MERWTKRLAALMGLALVVVSGCEWETSDDGDYWNNRVAWVDFSGVYRAPQGGAVVIPGDPGGGGSTDSLKLKEETIAVGNGMDTAFSGTLTNKPLYPGTLTIAAGGVSFKDEDGSGTLTPSPQAAGSGTVSLETGGYVLSFNAPPSAGVSITASYIYIVSQEGETPGPDDPAEDRVIARLTVQQDGNVLLLTDGGGTEYRGKMGRVSTPGGDVTGQTSGRVVANFEVEGGGIRMVGVFEGNYTRPTDGAPRGTMLNRVLRATWADPVGNSGNMDFTGE